MAVAVAEEKTAQQADRLAKHLTAELLDFLCCAVRAESADAVKKRSAQLRLAETVAKGIPEGPFDQVKADTVQYLSALFELYGQKGTATLLMSMKTAMAPSLYCNMPGYSTMEEAVKVAAGASEADAKAELAKLTETFAKWAADAAHKLPAKKTPAAPAVGKEQGVKLSCDRDQPLSEGYGGCFKCGSKYHRREDHKDSRREEATITTAAAAAAREASIARTADATITGLTSAERRCARSAVPQDIGAATARPAETPRKRRARPRARSRRRLRPRPKGKNPREINPKVPSTLWCPSNLWCVCERVC